MPLQRIDAHCHVQFSSYDADREEVIRRALGEGTGMIVIGTRQDTSSQAIAVADTYDGAWSAVGLHPSHLFDSHPDTDESPTSGQKETFDPDAYRALVKSTKKVVAIGEFGLDYFRIPDGHTFETVRARQHQVFRAHLDLAWELGLPAMVHIRDGQYAGQSASHHNAHIDAAALFQEYANAGKRMRGNIHCFTGTPEDAARYIALGLHISFTGIATFPPKTTAAARRPGPGAGNHVVENSKSLIDIASEIPLEHLLIETDAPYLAPLPHRGTRNEPAYVRHISAAIATRKRMLHADVDAATLENTKRLFEIKIY